MARASIVAPRCLLVEDEALIGMDLDDSLCAAGFEVRWVMSTRHAHEALATATFDVAVLDLIVRSEPCTPLACELKRCRVPFLVYSGQPRADSSAAFHGVPWLEKPAEPEAGIAALAAIMGPPEARRRDAEAVVPRSDQTSLR